MTTRGDQLKVTFVCNQCQRLSEMPLRAFATGPIVCSDNPLHQGIVAPNSHLYRLIDEVNKTQAQDDLEERAFWTPRGVFFARYNRTAKEVRVHQVGPAQTVEIATGKVGASGVVAQGIQWSAPVDGNTSGLILGWLEKADKQVLN